VRPEQHEQERRSGQGYNRESPEYSSPLSSTASPGNHKEADANGAQQYANHDGKDSLDDGQRVATNNLSKKTLSIATYSSPRASSTLSSRIAFRSFIGWV
jgi:hypothetical protein